MLKRSNASGILTMLMVWVALVSLAPLANAVRFDPSDGEKSAPGEIFWEASNLPEIEWHNSLNSNGANWHLQLRPASGVSYWLTRDPLGEAGGINLYQFVNNDPVNFVDPWGLVEFDEDGFPIMSEHGQLGDAYQYDSEEMERHNQIMDDAKSGVSCWIKNTISGLAKEYFNPLKKVSGTLGAAKKLRVLCKRTPKPKKPLGLGSTVDPSKGRYHPRNLREQLAVDEAMQNPKAGVEAAGPMNDPRWPASEGWIKQQQTINSGGRGGPISVHYNRNTVTEAVDDFKIVERKPYVPPVDPSVPPAGP